MLKKRIKKVVKYVCRRYYTVRHYPLIWFYVLNRKSRKLYNSAHSEFSPKEQKIISAVEHDGIAFAHISDFFEKEVYESLLQFVKKRWQDSDVQEQFRNRGVHLKKSTEGQAMIDGKNYFLMDLWNGPYVLDPRHVFIQFSLSKPILRIVSGYLKLFPKFRYWSLQATVPNIEGDEGNARASQRWHRDPDDKKMLKVFLYLNDVDREAGPFMYVKGTHSIGRHRRLFPGKPPQGTPKLPKIEDSMLPEQDIVIALGKEGTLIFADTSGLHKGGLAESKNRFMYTSAYMSEASVWPIQFKYPPNFVPTVFRESMACYAVENDSLQKEPVWY